MWDAEPSIAVNGWAPITAAQGWCFYSQLQWLFRGFSCPAIQNPTKLSGVFLPNLTFVSFQNQWIIVPVIAMGMETACLELAIASLAFWALTVVEVGISWLTLASLLLLFFSSSKLPSCPCLCQLHISKPGAAAGEWNQVRSVGFFCYLSWLLWP